MRNVKLIHINSFSLLLLLLMLFSSCSKSNEIGKWVESSNGIKVYVPKDFEKNYDKKSLSCQCVVLNDEITLLTPPFIITVKDKSGHSRTFNSTMPTIIPDSLLRHKEEGKGNAYWYVAGKIDKKGKAQGYAFEYKLEGDSILSLYEYGDFKDNKLTKGYRYIYNPESGNSYTVWGRFKNDKIYQGYKLRASNDSIVEKVIGLWDSDGSLNDTYLNMVRIHYAVMKKLGYNAHQQSVEDLKFTHRYFFWVNYKWSILIGLSVVGLLLFLLGFSFFPEETSDGKVNPEDYKLKPWTCRGAYWRWLFFPLGLEYIYLRKDIAYLLTSLLSLTLIVASSKFLVLYGLSPEYWLDLLSFYSPWQYYLLLFRVAIWIWSLIAIPYWVYLKNFNTFRHNIYEELIIGNQTLKYKSLCQRIAQGFKEEHDIIKKSREEAQIIYNEELGLLSRSFSFITNSKVNHAKEKAQALNEILSNLVPIAQRHERMASQLIQFLNIERRNAYRNMILAKELIMLLRNFKDNQSRLKTDNISQMEIDRPTDIHSGVSNISKVDFESSLLLGLNCFDNAFTMMKDLGMKDTDNLLVSLGAGVFEFAIDGIAQVNSRRTAEREHYENESARIIHRIKVLDKEIVKNDLKMIRANEIMMALSAANEAFVREYTPLRDSVFGEKASLGGYFSFLLRRHKIKANAKVDDIAHLIRTCSLYNKINQSKI
ncbi:MAG: hypothetical protein K2M53_02890 [Muribaculaceae bacterium]|nr:hypothetical protein [Muribaculaceae bacterium]